MSLTIGLLECDHVADNLVSSYGNYQQMFSDLLHIEDDQLAMKFYDLTADQFPTDLHTCDGYVITGSQFSVYEDIAWIHKAKALVVDLYQAGIPTVGICFGHQLMAEALGGKVIKAKDKGWGVGVHEWDITQSSDWMGENAPDKFSLRVSHQDQVVELPPESKLIARSDFCPIASFQLGEHFLAMQGHPEFSRGYAQALIDKRVEKIGEDVADVGRQSLTQKVDKNDVAAWMVNFIKKAQKQAKLG